MCNCYFSITLQSFPINTRFCKGVKNSFKYLVLFDVLKVHYETFTSSGHTVMLLNLLETYNLIFFGPICRIHKTTMILKTYI